MKEIEYYTTEEAGAELGVTGRQVAHLCRQGRLGRKIGRNWAITKDDLDSFVRIPPGPRPKKRRKK